MPPKTAPVARNRNAEFLGLALLVLGILILLGSLREDSGWIGNFVGVLRRLVGIGVFAIPLAMVFSGVLLLAGGQTFPLVRPALAFGLGLWVFLGFVHLRIPSDQMLAVAQWPEWGGFFGAILAFLLRKSVGLVGSYVVLTALAFCVLLVGTEAPPGQVLRAFVARVLDALEWVENLLRFRRAPQAGQARSRRANTPAQTPPPHEPESTSEVKPEAPSATKAAAKPRARSKGKSRKRSKKKAEKDQLGLFGDGSGLPQHYSTFVSALEPAAPTDVREQETDTDQNIRLVEDTLGSFRIEAKVINVKRGPVVTRYEIQPAPGIRVSRITNLSDDLALALAALSIRVEAPVPGKSVIGIEVPNKRNTIVRLREILELDDFRNHPSKLAFALGKDIAGNPMVGDLATMPHLLIGGATNSGKSVCLNCIIASILSRATPEQVKFSLIDPKRVELTLFQNIPHLFHPVVVDARDSIRALRGSIREMENRYKLFAERGVRNIATYNQRCENEEDKLYYIVIVIDEMADLMMQAAAEVERLICRLAQLARATGIHLVVATQRPSVNVITGIIKANISSRIAFSVASQMDSRVILDANGAERLLGSGDMLYHPIDFPKAVRLQGAYIDEVEVNHVVELLAEAHDDEPDFGLDLETISDEDESVTTRSKRSSGRDPLFDEAVAMVRRRRQASASMLQREFEIGYPRAGKIVDQMEEAGIVGPAQGSKPREVLAGAFADGSLTMVSDDGETTQIIGDDDGEDVFDEDDEVFVEEDEEVFIDEDEELVEA